MSEVTVTLPIAGTCNYVVTPNAVEGTNGQGVVIPDTLRGAVNQSEHETNTLSLDLDNAFTWDVAITFRGAPPILFEGFQPSNGGDLLTLLSSQGWQSL